MKAQVNFDALGGGGGSSAPTLLATKTTYDTNSFSLSQSIYDFTYVMVEMKTGGYSTKLRSTMVPTSIVDTTLAVDASLFSDSSTSYYCLAEIKFAADGLSAQFNRTYNSNFTMAELNIYGIG